MRRLVVLSLVCFARVALATSLVFTHSGYLLDGDDHAVNTTQPMVFRLYDLSADGALLWASNGSGGTANCGVPVAQGYYAVVLGTGGCGPAITSAAVPVSGAVYLEIEVNGVKLAPRTALHPSSEVTQLRAALAATGTLNAGSSLVDWSQLKGVSPGAGLTLSGGQLAVGTKAITAGLVGSGAAASGLALLADGSGGATWSTVLSTVTAANVSSGATLANRVLAADGAGGAAWVNSVGTLTLAANSGLTTSGGTALAVDPSAFAAGSIGGTKITAGTLPADRLDPTTQLSVAVLPEGAAKNYLINGAMDYFQRTASATSLNATLTYATADRFRVSASSGLVGTTARGTSGPNGRSRFTLDFLMNTATSGDFGLDQRIEAQSARELSSGTASVSAWVYSENATRLTLTVSAAASGVDDWTSATSLATRTATLTTGSWQLVKFENLSLSSAAASGLQIGLRFDQTTAGTNKRHALTQLMLNAGASAAPFTPAGRTPAEEELLCLRYFESGTSAAQGFGQTATSDTGPQNLVFFKARKRAVPTVVRSNESKAGYGNCSLYRYFFDENVNQDRYLTNTYCAGSGSANFVVSFNWTASAEL